MLQMLVDLTAAASDLMCWSSGGGENGARAPALQVIKRNIAAVVDTGIVISSSSDEEVAPEPENEDVIITSDTEEEKGMWDSFCQ